MAFRDFCFLEFDRLMLYHRLCVGSVAELLNECVVVFSSTYHISSTKDRMGRIMTSEHLNGSIESFYLLITVAINVRLLHNYKKSPKCIIK